MSDGDDEVVDSPFWTFEEDEEYSRDHSAFLDDSHHDNDISLEYENRRGISVDDVHDSWLQEEGRPRSGGSAIQRGEDGWKVARPSDAIVRDPLILLRLRHGSGPTADDGLCRRGTRVMLRGSYAAKHGLGSCKGLIGMLGKRGADVGTWQVRFPSFTYDHMVHVGKDGKFGLVYAERCRGALSAGASTMPRRLERELKTIGRAIGTHRPCNPELQANDDDDVEDHVPAKPPPSRVDSSSAALDIASKMSASSAKALERIQMAQRSKVQEGLERRYQGPQVMTYRGRLIQEVKSEATGEPLHLVYRDTKEVMCPAGEVERYSQILSKAEVVHGLVVDGEAWVKNGTCYECVRGAKVMMLEGYAKGSKYLQHAFGRGSDGARAVGLLTRRARLGEWWVQFPGGVPEVLLPVGIDGQYALQFVDPLMWAAREARYKTPLQATHPRVSFWPGRSVGTHCTGRSVSGAGQQAEWHKQACVCKGRSRVCGGRVCGGMVQPGRGVPGALGADAMAHLWTDHGRR